MDKISRPVNRGVDKKSNLCEIICMIDAITWEMVDRTGKKLGANDDARRKWRDRKKVPFRWQIRIVEELRARGIAISFADFDNVVEEAA